MSAQRRSTESFEDYRQRLKTEALQLKARLRGRLLWNSLSQGTYVRRRDGDLL